MTVIPMRRAVALAHRALSSRARPSRREFDVVIAGGGVVGSSTAYHLARDAPSLRIAVVERDASYTHCSAPLSAGGIRQQFSMRENILMSLYGVVCTVPILFFDPCWLYLQRNTVAVNNLSPSTFGQGFLKEAGETLRVEGQQDAPDVRHLLLSLMATSSA